MDIILGILFIVSVSALIVSVLGLFSMIGATSHKENRHE